jgi:hypothetical protein
MEPRWKTLTYSINPNLRIAGGAIRTGQTNTAHSLSRRRHAARAFVQDLRFLSAEKCDGIYQVKASNQQVEIRALMLYNSKYYIIII